MNLSTPTTLSYSALTEVVRRFAPIIRFSKDEAYWPANVDDFLPRMILQKGTDDSYKSVSTIYDQPMSKELLVSQGEPLGNLGILRTLNDLNEPSDTQEWMNGNKPSAQHPVHTYVVVTNRLASSCDSIDVNNVNAEITYWLFFNYNQGKTVASTSFGNHVADWTHVKLVVINNKIAQVMYDHHGDKTRYRFPDPQVEKLGQQVVVYAACGSHECYWRPGDYELALGTHDQCDNGTEVNLQQGEFEIYPFNTQSNNFEKFSDPAYPDPQWLQYKGRWGNSIRGEFSTDDIPIIGPILNLAGKSYSVARLENGPEGLFRPQEYAVDQMNFYNGYTGYTSDTNPSAAVWFNNSYRLYFKDPSGKAIFHISSPDMFSWSERTNIGHNCSDAPYALVFQNRMHLLFRDGNGNGLMHMASDDGVNNWGDEQYCGIDIDWRPSVANYDNQYLMVLGKDAGNNNGIMYACMNGSGSWFLHGYTGFNCNYAPGGIVQFNGHLRAFFCDGNGNGILRLIWDDNEAKWKSASNIDGQSWYIGFNTSGSPTAVVVAEKLWIYYRDPDGNGILRVVSDDGINFYAPPLSYIGLNCDESPAAALGENGQDVIITCKDHDGTGIMFSIISEAQKAMLGHIAPHPTVASTTTGVKNFTRSKIQELKALARSVESRFCKWLKVAKS